MFLDFLKRLFYTKKRSDRLYHFDLPYRIAPMYLHYGKKQLLDAGVFQKLPKDMQQRWNRAVDRWLPLKIYAEDLNRIDDETWAKIAHKLGLKWENK